MTIKVYKKGATDLTEFNYDVPTNPRITTTSGSTITPDGSRLFGAIYEDGSEVGTYDIVSGATYLDTEYNNLANTKGYRIKCYDSVTSTGIQLNGITDLATRYYFVLIHSDDENLHHFARITDINTEDVDGASFDFTPALGKSIPKDTKFMLFKGSVISTTKAIAFTAGIKKEHQTKMYCARPLFYFVDGLDKKNELNHNTKYMFRFRGTVLSSTTSVTLDQNTSTFVTCADFGNSLIDYSRFQLKISITDKLKENDFSNSSVNRQEGSGTFSNTVSGSYGNVFPHARTIDDDDLSSWNNLGTKRYLHYDFSKTITNIVPNVYQAEVLQSNQNRGSFAESKAVDSFRLLPKKIIENDLFRVRQSVHNGNLTDWIDTGIPLGEYDSVNNRYTLGLSQTFVDLIPINTQIKIGNRICIVDIVTQSYLTVTKSRLETESTFTTSMSLAQYQSIEGEKIYLRSFSPENSVLFSTFKPIEGRTDELFVKIQTESMGIRYLKVTKADSTDILAGADNLIQISALTLSPVNSDAYDSKPFKYAQGQYEISIERFYGNVENIYSTKEQGQTIMTISGRDRFSRLLNPIINKNTLFSEDIIYSSYSPLSEKTVLTPTLNNADFDSETIVFNSNVTLSEGDLLFNGDSFIGEVSQDYSGSTSIVLKAKSRLFQATGGTLQISKLSKKQYILNKALSSNPLLESATSLNGASDKILSFTSGVKIHTDGTEKLLDVNNSESSFDLLSGNSAVEDTEPESNAYFITEAKSVGLDSTHSLFLTETEYNTSDKENFATVNTLIDFTIISDKGTNGFNRVVTVAPYNPLTLGRVDYNFQNTRDTTYHTTLLGTGTGTKGNRYVDITSNKSSTFTLSSRTSPRRRHGEPLYDDSNNFLGIIMSIENSNVSTNALVVLDRPLYKSYVGDFKVISFDPSHTKTKLQHELNFINGAHLHGGKYVALLNNFQDQDADAFSATAFFNTRLMYGTLGESNTYREKYNNPLYRISNLEKGTYNHKVQSYDSGYQDYYLGVGSKIKYYAEAYRGTSKTGAFQTNVTRNHSLFESRGWTSVYGSKFYERPINGSGESHPLTFFRKATTNDIIDTRQKLEQIDPKVARMFLFINSDIQPYSNTRKDSIRNSNTRTITNYNLMGIKKGNTTEVTSQKHSASGRSSSINFVDSDYVSAIPVSSSSSINTGKQFSMMRLTEVVYDWHFNQIDPENLPKLNKTYPKITVNVQEINPLLDGVNTIRASITSTNTITCIDTGGSPIDPHAGASGLNAGDLICDEHGRFIGEVDSSSSGTTITLTANAIPVDGNNYLTNRDLYKVTFPDSATLAGHGKLDSFVKFEDSIHPLKGTVFRGIITAGEFGHSDSSEDSAFKEEYGRDLDSDGTNTIQSTREPNIIFPINIDDTYLSKDPPSTDNYSFTSRIIKDIQRMKETMTTTTETIEDYLYNNCNIVAFSSYSIEDGGGSKVSEGMTTPLINSSKTQDNNITSTPLGFLTANFRGSTAYEFAKFEDIAKQKERTYDLDAEGIIMGIKPHITLVNTDFIHANTDNLNGNHTNTYSIDSQSTSKGMRFLDYVDLTGCYLVDIDGEAYTTTSTKTSVSNKADYNPTNIFYIVSHEIDSSTTGTKHLLTIDGAVPTGTTTYRIMQPNHTCLYSYSPNQIRLNEVSPKYTKKAYSDEMYDNIFDYEIREKRGDETPYSGQGVMSMYVAIDINKHTDSNYVVIRDANKISDLLDEGNYEMVLSDGENSYSTSLEYIDNDDTIGHYFVIDEMQELNGVISVSEPIEITYSGNLQDCERLLIGSTLEIAHETEDLVNELVEEEGITLNNSTTNDYPFLLAPNYRGVNLFTVITQLLSKKNKRLKLVEETFEVIESNSSEVYSNIILSDFGDNQIYEYEREKSLFDFYNEVIVYGRVHKRINKNLSSIQKVGRKTLEVYDRKLETQAEVNKRARDLLRLHSSDNEKLNVVVRQKNMAQIRPSDIISVEIRRENIPLNNYEVLQITHTLDGMMKLQLGKFSKGLEERFAELQIQNAETNASIRVEEQDVNVNSFDFLENLNIKPLRVVVRKRASSGNFKLGFTKKLGFDTQLGFDGDITITELQELEF